MLALLGFLVTIIIVVGIHEYGHYFAARSVGIKVIRFAIGFGKPLFSRTDKNGTQWCLCPIPLGGYVQMVNDPEMAKEMGIPPEQSLEGVSRLKRSWVIAAGPLANFVLAVLLFFILGLLGETGLKAQVGKVINGSPAQFAGFTVGDNIVGVDGHNAVLWSTVYEDLFTAVSDHDAKIDVVAQGGVKRSLILPTGSMEPEILDKVNLIEHLGLVPDRNFTTLEIEEIVADSPAAFAGLLKGDFFIAADGQLVEDWDALVKIIRDNSGKEISVIYERDGQQLESLVTPTAIEEDGVVFGRIGIVPIFDREKYDSMLITQSQGPIDAAKSATRRTWKAITTTVRFFGYLLTGRLSTDNLSGPIGIAQTASVAAGLGYKVFLLFVAQISISLGVINLVPIPLLDGGHLLRYFLEGLFRRPLHAKIIKVAAFFGGACLLSLMIFAVYNDLT